jgi:CoA:oxalate CoA-transferase
VSTQDVMSRVLDGWQVTANGKVELPARVCAEHLAMLGASWDTEHNDATRDGINAHLAGHLVIRSEPGGEARSPLHEGVDCAIGWQSSAMGDPKPLGAELVIQALSGLMAVHGREQRFPRRLGLDVASVAAGIAAAQGILAALIGVSRGQAPKSVATSVLQAALLFLYHHLAIATCGEDFPNLPSGSALGPPFPTSDQFWVEIEVLTFEAWTAFWKHLGIEQSDRESAWSIFVFRYLTANCKLPATFHEATKQYTLGELSRIAKVHDVAICRVRSYHEVLSEPGWSKAGDRQMHDGAQHLAAPWTIGAELQPSWCDWARTTTADAPLAGLTVIEVTSRLQGPLAGLLLHLLGANVVKVEPPGGDFGRHAPPRAGSLGAAYLAYNRGKQVVEIDYKQPDGQEQLANLLNNADVFLHNWRSGRAERLGFDYKVLARHNPKLVYAHASGWGRSGDEPSPIAGDYLVQAYAGCGDGLAPLDEMPFPSRLTLIDVTGGLLACEGILAGLYHRERAGQGCRVDTSLLAGAMTLQRHVLRQIMTEHEAGRRLGRPLWGLLDRPMETADGFLVVEAGDESTRKRISEICGLMCFVGPQALDEQILKQLRSRPSSEWEQRFLAAGIPAATVCSDLTSLPHDHRVSGFLERVNDACWLPSAPWRFAT